MNIIQNFVKRFQGEPVQTLEQLKAVETLEQLKKEKLDWLTFPKLCDSEIPLELCEEIFMYLTGHDLTNCALVNKKWYKLASQEKDNIFEQYIIGPRMWRQKVNVDIGKADPIPKDILKILGQPCPFFEGKNVRQTHMLVWIPSKINGEPLSLNSLGQCVKVKSFPDNADGYDYYWDLVKNRIGDKAIEQGGWVLMTKDVLPGSRTKNYTQQKNMVEKCKGYEVPKVLEAAFCIFAKFYSSDIRLYSENPGTLTRCRDQIYDLQICIGDFALSGLEICNFIDGERSGVAALRKLI